MRSLHFHLPFGMYHRACAPPIRFRLLPTLWTGDLLVPPISMLQQQLPQHLSHQLPPQHRQLACYLIKVRLPMLFPPLPHLLKHLLCASYKFRLRLFSFHFAPPLLFSVPTPSLTPFSLAKNLGCTRQFLRFAGGLWTVLYCACLSCYFFELRLLTVSPANKPPLAPIRSIRSTCPVPQRLVPAFLRLHRP